MVSRPIHRAERGHTYQPHPKAIGSAPERVNLRSTKEEARAECSGGSGGAVCGVSHGQTVYNVDNYVFFGIVCS